MPTLLQPTPSQTLSVSRAEVELRQRLAERDARVCQLKQELEDKQRQGEALQRRVNELLGSGNNNSNGGNHSSGLGPSFGRQAAGGLSVGGAGSSRMHSGAGTPNRLSPRTSPRNSFRNGSVRGSVPLSNAPWAALPGDMSKQQQGLVYMAVGAEVSGSVPTAEQIFSRISSNIGAKGEGQGVEVSMSGLAAAEKEYLAHQIAALRITLAKRDADVTRLEGEGAGGWGS